MTNKEDLLNNKDFYKSKIIIWRIRNLTKWSGDAKLKFPVIEKGVLNLL